jgi:hypothetical protein
MLLNELVQVFDTHPDELAGIIIFLVLVGAELCCGQ